MRIGLSAICAVTCFTCSSTQNQGRQSVPAVSTHLSRQSEAAKSFSLPDDVVAAILERIAAGTYSGLVVGVINRDGPQVYGFGSQGLATGQPRANDVPDGSTVYEIGSITKLFTGVLLADMVLRNEVRLDAPVAEYLPAARVPQFENEPIDIVSLITHTSGLPRFPDNLASDKYGNNPFAGYTHELLHDALGRFELQRAPGERFEYSNLGVGLLGYALAVRAGMSYEELLRSRVTRILGLSDTVIHPSDDLNTRLALGSLWGERTPAWDASVLSAAGGLRSTARDLLRFLGANMGQLETPLRDALELARAVHYRSADGAISAGLGWVIEDQRASGLLTHAGGTPGYSSFIGMRRSGDLGVVVLTNAGVVDVTDLGMHLLAPQELLHALPRPVSEEELAAVRARTLVVDGDFSLGTSDWWQQPGSEEDGKLAIKDGALCLHTTRKGNLQLGWPAIQELAVQLVQGQRYSLFFRASAQGPFAVALEVKVLHRGAPSTVLGTAEMRLTNMPQIYRFDFVPAASDDGAGILVNLYTLSKPGAYTFCIDDVVLVQREPSR